MSEKPSPALSIRPATAADRPRLIPLINSAFAIETFLEGTRTDDARLAATMEKGEILLAESSSGQILGCVYVELRPAEDDSHQAGARGYLGQLAVDPQHQGVGLARQLVTAAENALRERGCRAVEITVLSLRPELLPLYRRFGYVESGTEEFSYRAPVPGQQCHCIVMTKQLDAAPGNS
jgi:predicted N-acetyltransferase YhbS